MATADEKKSDYLAPADVAQRYGVSVDCVLGWIRHGHLRAINVSITPRSKRPRFRISEAELEAFEQARSTSGRVKRSTRRGYVSQLI